MNSGLNMTKNFNIILLSSFFAFLSCSDNETKEMEVTATAFNSVRYQTTSQPRITAWGDTLEPGMKSIAVSRDLIDSGLTHMTPVFIEELGEEYIVRDKMAGRWRKKIDIYMGKNIDSAQKFGKRKVTIKWKSSKEK